ncbi:alginate lyase family protein [Thalassoroseus pseudoceratinae]|uniref:alginate lyase family protein n=1 Tax=Thalassoroseus pseudoceratinae TaxID=2713176 RepID=UPI00197D946C|nr:alginate lyase family protein [Thalassoroseus pseudoceratinae]
MNMPMNGVLPVFLTMPYRLRRVVVTICCFVAYLYISNDVTGDEPSREAKSVNSATSRPIVLVGPEELARLRKNSASKKSHLSTAWQNLQADANKALTTEYSPYIGSNSVEFAASGLAAGAAIRDLCLVFEVTGERRYAERARAIMVAWATHQPQPGRNLEKEPYRGQSHGATMAGLGLNVGVFARSMANAYSLVWPHLSETERSAIENWLRFLATEIQEGHEAWIDNDYYGKQYFNNHLSGHNMGLAAIGYAIGYDELIAYALDSPENPCDWKEMHDGAILMESKPNRSQLNPIDPTLTKGAAPPGSGEIYDRYRVVTVRDGRGCGMPYAFLHQRMLVLTAEMAFLNGRDLYRYKGPHGENLRLTFDAYAPHLLKVEPVARGGYYQGNRVYESQVHLFELAARRYERSSPVTQVLDSLNRAVYDHETYGWTAVLLHADD